MHWLFIGMLIGYILNPVIKLLITKLKDKVSGM